MLNKQLAVFVCVLIGILCIATGLSGCGTPTSFVVQETRSCATRELAEGLEVDCGSGVTIIKHGKNGSDGLTPVVTMASGLAPGCPAGGSTLVIGYDSDADGVADQNVQSSEICDGVDGVASTTPPSALTPVAILDPCGDAPGVHDELLLRLYDGTVLSSFSDDKNGKNTRLSALLVNQAYQTTDGDGCAFKLDANGLLTQESHRN